MCRSGDACDPLTGSCVADPCATLHCPGDQVCRDGECAMMAPPDAGVDSGGTEKPDAGTPANPSRHVFATGGGGCVCSVPGAPAGGRFPWVLGLLLLVGMVAMRGRRGRGR